MTDQTKLEELAELFKQTGEAHHQAFSETSGEDPEWAIWYADYLQDRVTSFLAAPISRSRLVFCLIGADDEHRATESDVPWPRYYAERFVECLGPAEEPAKDQLALYYFVGCPFCMRVLRTLEQLGVEADLRNIHEDRRHFQELLGARGRATVPVLRITASDGEERWMPESADIVRYLEATYQKAA